MSAFPSVKQMAQRANDGHRKALRKLSTPDGGLLVHASEPDSSVRGMMTVMRTLSRWGCVEGRDRIVTERGSALLTELDARYVKTRAWDR